MGDVVLNSKSNFSAIKHDINFAQNPQVTTERTLPPKQYYPSPFEKPQDAFYQKETKEKKTHKALITTAIATGSIASVAILFSILTKGKMTKTIAKKLGEYTQKLSEKIELLKQQQSKNAENSKLNPHNITKSHLYLSLLQKTHKGLMMVRGAIFNFTPLKDVLFEKIVCDKLKLRKPCNAITNSFRKLSLSTVKSSYASAGKSVNSMTTLFAETNKALEAGQIAGAKPISKETMTKLTEKVAKIGEEFNTHFSEKAVLERDKGVSAICKNLSSRVYDRIYGNLKNFVKDIKTMTTFIPEMLIEKDKSVFLKSILAKKRIITNNPLDNYKQISEAISRLERSINPNDKGSRELLGALRKLSREYVNASGPTEEMTRINVGRKINALLKQSKETTSNMIYSPKEAANIKSQLGEIGRIVNTDKKGLVEELLSTYKEILPPEKYKELKASAKKATEKINNATMQEGSEYVDKVRDLASGSALTDVAFGLALPLGSTAIAVSATKTKEKKQSVALKYGIPVLTGAMTSMIATVKLVSGGKALGLGLASTLITNQICERIDKKLKEKHAKTLNA